MADQGRVTIDINLLDVWGNVQDRVTKAVLEALVGTAPYVPDDPIMAYRYLEEIRQQARRVV